MGICITNVKRLEKTVLDSFAEFGTATVHEAQGRAGLLDAAMCPVFAGAHIAGSAVTVSVDPGDNSMIHVAVEQCQDADVLVVAPRAPSDAGYFGELLATALQFRGVRGLVIDAGCRDVAELERMDFPVWSRHISAFGTVKETVGDVNVPVVCAGQQVVAGDVVVADDDGVVIVPQSQALRVLAASRAREEKEAETRRHYAAGGLGLDANGLRDRLVERGLVYMDQADVPWAAAR